MSTARSLNVDPKFFKLVKPTTKDGDFPYHDLSADRPYLRGRKRTALAKLEDRLESPRPLALVWQPFPTMVRKGPHMPVAFFFESSQIAFPEKLTAKLLQLFPNTFEWLPLKIQSQDPLGFEQPVETAFSRRIAALNLHLMHFTRPVRLCENSKAMEFEGPSGQKMDEITVFAQVDVYAFSRKQIDGLAIFYVIQDMSVVCTDSFRAACKQLKVTGLDFQPIRAVVN